MLKNNSRPVVATLFVILIFALSAAAQYGGTTAVYRLYNASNGDHVYTRDCNEKNSLQQSGYNYEGVAFYISTNSRGRTRPLYRVYLTSGEHLYTTDQQELNTLRYTPGNREEGILGYISDRGGRNLVPLYRLYNGTLHFFTTNEQEMSNYLSQGGRQEGITGYVWTSGSNPCDSYGAYPNQYPNQYPPRPYPYPQPINRGVPTIYSLGNFGGNALPIDRDWPGSSDWDRDSNRVRSIQVPLGWSVVVYDKTNYRGRSLNITSNWSPQPNDYWYNRVRSIRVYRGQAPFPQ
jgi:hypothetical protein